MNDQFQNNILKSCHVISNDGMEKSLIKNHFSSISINAYTDLSYCAEIIVPLNEVINYYQSF